MSNGLSMTAKAPSARAASARSGVPWAVIRITGRVRRQTTHGGQDVQIVRVRQSQIEEHEATRRAIPGKATIADCASAASVTCQP